ncbi:MAG: VWA domain-containing protein [Acidimicrobiales bacterium]
MIAISYLAPSRFWLLIVVAALAAGYVTLQLRRRSYAVRFTNLDLLQSIAPRSPGWRRHIPAVVMLLALVVLVTALARPAREERVPRERATVILAVDTSLSMKAEDVPPNRIDAAKRAAKVFLDIIPPKINVGLVSFNGSARVDVGPTTDRDAVKIAIDNLELAERTAIGEGIFASLQAIKAAPKAKNAKEPVPARIVLMSDGETTVGRPDSVASQEAKRQKVPVTTIAFGTDDGFIEVPNETGEMEVTPVRVNREALERIADDTGGKAFTAATENELKQVYTDIGSSVGFITEFREIGLWFVGLAVLLLFATSTMSLLWFSRLP